MLCVLATFTFRIPRRNASWASGVLRSMKPAGAILGAMLLAACTQQAPASSTPAHPSPTSAVTSAITEFPTLTANSRPGDITRGPDGNLWFVELAANKVAKVTTSGSIFEFPLPPGTQPGSITAGPDGNIWVAGGDNRVTKVTTSGHATKYTPPSYWAGAITAGPDGNLWITEPCSAASDVGAKVAKLTPSGAFTEYVVPRAGDMPADPSGIAAGPDGNIWFTEEGARKVVKVTPSGSFTEYPIPSGYEGPESITAGPDGNLWFLEYGGLKVAKMTTSGTFTEYRVSPVPSTTDYAPGSITAGSDGNVWFTQVFPNEVTRLTTSGDFTEFAIPSSGLPLSPSACPAGITSGPDGNIWFTESCANKVAKLVPHKPA